MKLGVDVIGPYGLSDSVSFIFSLRVKESRQSKLVDPLGLLDINPSWVYVKNFLLSQSYKNQNMSFIYGVTSEAKVLLNLVLLMFFVCL